MLIYSYGNKEIGLFVQQGGFKQFKHYKVITETTRISDICLGKLWLSSFHDDIRSSKIFSFFC
jgi:hypothetical protein